MTGCSSGSRDTPEPARTSADGAAVRERLLDHEIEDAGERSSEHKAAARRLAERLAITTRAVIAASTR